MATVTSTQNFTATVSGSPEVGQVNESFSAITSASGTDIASATGVVLYATTTSNQYGNLARIIQLFNTSSLPSNATITSADLTIIPNNVYTALGTTTLEIVSSSPSSTTGLVASDFNKLGSTSFGSVSQSSLTANSAYVYTLNSSGISNINIGGVSKFGFKLGWELSGSAPWVSNKSSWVYLNDTSVLSVTYTQPTLSISNAPSSLSNIQTITTS